MGYLSEIARRRIAAGILIVGAVVAVLAITDAAVFDDPPTAEEQVAEAVGDFFAAGAAGDFEAYCARLTEGAREFVQASAARLLQASGEESPSCPEVVEAAGDGLRGLSARVRSVSVSGNRARVEVSVKPARGPAQIRTLLLEEDDQAGWLVADAG